MTRHTKPLLSESGICRFVAAILCAAITAQTFTGAEAASSVSSRTGVGHDKVVVCYLSSWAVYRPGRGSFAIENFDPTLCTHAVYAFAGLDYERDAIKSLDEWQDLREQYGKAGYERIVALRNRYPHLKVSLAIGGWNEGSANYSRMSADAGRRSRFVKQATEFIRQYSFDGLDLDWEYPTQRGGQPHDRENFVALVRELRTAFRPHNLLLTSAIGAARNIINAAYDVRALSAQLDYLHIMCYDYGGAWDRRVTANAPLHSGDALNVQSTVDHLLELGASAEKLVLGVPFYGRTFVANAGGDGRLGDASSDVGFQGPFTKENGFLGYNEICSMLGKPDGGWLREYDAETHQAIGRWHNETSQQWQTVTFDSQRSMAVKARFAVRQRLAGVMVWSVDTDDFLGDCTADADIYADFPKAGGYVASRKTNYPLLRTLNEAIALAQDELEREREDAENEIPHGDGGSHDDGGGAAALQVTVWTMGAMLVAAVGLRSVF